MKKNLFLCLLLFLGIISAVHSQGCGGIFTDPAGPNTNYANNTDYTVTICPNNFDEKVTVTFTAFSTEAQFDALYVFDGNSTVSPQITSSNGAGNVPGGLAGGYWGSTIPGPFTSTSPDGCLTFRFRSDSSSNATGWIANVTCAPPPTCSSPIAFSANTITHNSVTINWTQPINPDTSFAGAWDIIVQPCGAPSPLPTSTGYISASSNPFVVTGLNPATCYDICIRARCSSNETTPWVCANAITTLSAPPVCGGQFVDNGGATGNYANNSDGISTVCPTNPGETVTVTFTSFNTEATWDALYVFDGNSIASPQISSGNPVTNIPGSIAGGYWGSAIPGPFTSSSPDGCLTFRFRSDGSVTSEGWIANVTCAPPPTCLNPTNLSVTSITTNSVILGWTDNTAISSWEILVLLAGSPTPSINAAGQQVVTTNPTLITGLTPGTAYSFYVRANCAAGDHSFWSLKSDATTLISNDECINAIEIPISGYSCTQPIIGNISGATASNQPLDQSCIGTPDDDAWFKFTATSTTLNVGLSNILGSTNNLNFAIYSGTCDALTSFFCSTANQTNTRITNLSIGTTYYLRIYSNANTPQTTTFGICITIPSTCANSQSVCGANSYNNTTGAPSIGTIGCLFTTPNPTFFNLRIASTGPVNLLLTQSTTPGGQPNIDVDYAAWGPFTSLDAACSFIGSSQPYPTPSIDLLNQWSACAYSAAPTENLNIANAVAGQYYIILVTNFSNRVGYINVTQTNLSAIGAGSIDCSGIRLNAFLDSNANGIQDSGEVNFPLGQFHYEINNNGSSHSIISPTGSYILYDPVNTNLYNLSYTVNSDYNNLYTTPPSFANVNISSGIMNTYNFPVTILQNYTDVGVTIVPQNSPRAGASYSVKIVYTNNGNQTLSTGSLTFNNDPGTTITNVSQTGTTTITNGFTYAFTNLLPFESRSMIVTLSVPSIPVVSLGQLLTNTVSVTPPSGDVVANNNNNSLSQVVIGSYDPNDKIEGHGEKILFSSFTTNDYLEYTIRFENNGTAGALNVLVNDILDNKLDESTLVMLDASHSYTLDRLSNNLTWKFDNIQLPVSIPNTDIGKGFVKFKIKPKPGYAVGDIIPNTAEIFFDSNPAIVTNTFNSEFVATLGNELFTENSIILYPNPATSIVQISLYNSTEIIKNIVVYDILGKKVSQVSEIASNQSSIDVSQLSKGVYLVEIATENNLKQTKKLIIQ